MDSDQDMTLDETEDAEVDYDSEVQGGSDVG